METPPVGVRAKGSKALGEFIYVTRLDAPAVLGLCPDLGVDRPVISFRFRSPGGRGYCFTPNDVSSSILEIEMSPGRMLKDLFGSRHQQARESLWTDFQNRQTTR